VNGWNSLPLDESGWQPATVFDPPKAPRKNKRSPIVVTATLSTAANSTSFPLQ
jgi:hypothetical protein